MNLKQAENKVVKELSSAIESKFNQLTSELYRVYNESALKRVDDMKLQNELLQKTFKIVAGMFGIDYCEGYDYSQMKESTSDLINKLDTLSKESKPLKRYFAFSVPDDCGHVNCYVVTEKNEEYLSCIIDSQELSDSEYNHLYLDGNKIIMALAKKLNKDLQWVIDMGLKELLDEIEEFFKEIIKDDSVSVETFSEYLESILDTSRNSARAKTWVML